MKLKTLEEAIALIEQLTTQVTDLTEKNKTILKEKKDVLELFNKEDKEGMTENERKLATALEEATAKIADMEKAQKADAEHRTRQEQETTSKKIEERIAKVAKGDQAVADKLKANVALLEKLPRSTDAELDAVITSAYNMLGTKDVSPLNALNDTKGGTPKVEERTSFADTQAGKSVAGKLGLDAVVKPPEESK